MYTLGISAFYHDSAAVLLKDDTILSAAQEERFTRKKHDASFPSHSIKYCLEQAHISLQELSAISFYDKPFLKFERLLETYYAFAPKGLSSFLTAMPVWIKEKMMIKSVILRELGSIEKIDKKKLKIFFPEHHLSHAASAFFPSPFKESAILTIDGVGEWTTTSISHGKNNAITALNELHFPHSLGLLYSAFTYYLGFKVNSGEYKLMGLAPYGNPYSDNLKKYQKAIYDNLLDVKDDGSIWLNQKYFNYAIGLTMVQGKKWEELFGFPRRKPEAELTQEHCDLALAIQMVTEEIVLKLAKEAKRLTGSDYLCLAGGVALNCVSNGKLVKAGLFKDVWIQPAAGDAGGAIGAAYAVYHIYYEKEKKCPAAMDKMKGSYAGPEFSAADVQVTVRKYKAEYEHYDSFISLCDKVADLLAQGNAVGWFQGRMEFGPRALGNRSILGDARNPEMQKKLNLKIKYRESFRPFAPSVLAEDSKHYFELDGVSPYMLLIANVVKKRRKQLPKGYYGFPLKEKLYYQRSDLPAITHLDYSARLQTVHKETNERYWQLILSFREKTGYGVIVNTSFNVRGEPIVCTPEDAYACFMRTEMDYLVIGNYLFDKKRQPCWQEKGDWRQQFALD